MIKPATYIKPLLLATIGLICFQGALAQKDSTLTEADIDDLDALFSDLGSLLDSITKPKSFGTVSLMAGNRLLNVQSNSGQATTTQSLMLSPSAAYYHKSGLGIAATAMMLTQSGSLKPSQYLATVSYDYLKFKKVMTGIAFTRFTRPDSLNYYTSPLKNELSAYALYRKSWFKPSVSVSYGWGTKTEVSRQAVLYKALREKARKRRGGSGPIEVPLEIVTTTSESVSDWMVSFSARHDFYYFNVLSKKDHFRFSPQLSFTGGTQQFGFNQSTNGYMVKVSDAINKPFLSDQVALQEFTKFQPLAVTAFLRTAYNRGKFFVQPQFALDYYIPTSDQHLTASFAVNTGIIF